VIAAYLDGGNALMLAIRLLQVELLLVVLQMIDRLRGERR